MGTNTLSDLNVCLLPKCLPMMVRLLPSGRMSMEECLAMVPLVDRDGSVRT